MPQDQPTDRIVSVPLHRMAHARSGDKGERINIAVFAYRPEFTPYLAAALTNARVEALFSHRGAIRVTRYDLPKLDAFNIVIDGVLEGGVNGSLNLDGHGKSQSFRLLSAVADVPYEFALAHGLLDDEAALAAE